MPVSVEQIQQGTPTSLLTTELNSLASGSIGTLGSAINNVQATSNLNGYTDGVLWLHLAAYTGTPTAGTSYDVYFLRSPDGGTTYEEGSGSLLPARRPDCVIPALAKASGPAELVQACRIPVGNSKPLLKNNGTGVTMAATGNILKITPETVQGV